MSSATNLLAKGQDARLRQRSGMSLERQGCRLGEVFDDLDQFVRAVTVLATEFDELACLRHDDTALGCSRHGDASTATELEKSFLPKELQRTQQGVLVHSEDGGEILGCREAFTGLCFSVCDCSSYLGRDLFVEVGRVGFVHLDTNHGPSNTSPIGLRRKT